jgi:hypothetical protein
VVSWLVQINYVIYYEIFIEIDKFSCTANHSIMDRFKLKATSAMRKSDNRTVTPKFETVGLDASLPTLPEFESDLPHTIDPSPNSSRVIVGIK